MMSIPDEDRERNVAIKDLRIVFMGTPEFAVASLEALIEAGCTIAAVITAPDKPSGRGMKLTESAVKKFALEKKLAVLQPVKLKDPAFTEILRNLRADLQVVVAFRMLPEIIWSMPPMGTINVHASLLPQYRGAAPINWSVINGEKKTGITTFKLQQHIDTGNILLQEAVDIGPDETAGELHDRLKVVGASLLVKTIQQLSAGTLREIPQEELITGEVVASNAALIKQAPKIFSETCRINWHQEVDNIYNHIRGLSPSPGAFTLFEGKTLKIFRCEKEKGYPRGEPGTVLTDERNYLKFACTDGYISCMEVQLEGKRKMKIVEFLNGYRFPPKH